MTVSLGMPYRSMATTTPIASSRAALLTGISFSIARACTFISLFSPLPIALIGRCAFAADPIGHEGKYVTAQHFDTRIAPILAANCLECHSESQPEGKLDLTQRTTTMSGGESGPALVPHDPEASLLWARIASNEMPPNHPLEPDERRLLKEWIRGGAVWGTQPIDRFQYTTARRAGYDWWSLRPLPMARGLIPSGKMEISWANNPIDLFILAKLQENGLSPSERASPHTLVRRLYIDLLGLLPNAKQVDQFQKMASTQAWLKLIDQVLASPHYGERWARHWMDVVRFGESDGYEYNSPRHHAWHYRDWLIRSFNSDMRFDQFTRMQLAGDAYFPNTLEGHAATGFLVAGVHNTVVGSTPQMKQTARQEELEELVGTIAQTFLGLTVNCARCHDHKFDPISTEEYYQFSAAVAGVGHGEKQVHGNAGDARVYTATSTPPGPVHVLHRGDVLRPGAEVDPAGLRAIQTMPASFSGGRSATDFQRRTDLATWITDPRNPAIARVIVNRIWHYHFGVGIVETPNDFGFNGGRPSHPALLDWLAQWFQDNDYSIKRLHRLILSSATYQQASRVRPDGTRVDAGNRLLWRQNPRRVEAEVLRDTMLQVAGCLNRRQHGESYRDVKRTSVPPANYYLPIDPVGHAFDRRTIYRWNVRGQRSALLDTFDCPDPSALTPRRNITTTPSQALSLWNDSFVLRASQQLANRIQREVHPGERSDEDQIGPQHVDQAWRIILLRDPNEHERIESLNLARQHGLALLCRSLLNTNEFVLVD